MIIFAIFTHAYLELKLKGQHVRNGHLYLHIDLIKERVQFESLGHPPLSVSPHGTRKWMDRWTSTDDGACVKGTMQKNIMYSPVTFTHN